MARITPAGVQSIGLSGFVEQIENAFRAALGQDLNLASETPQGQLIGSLAEVLAEAEEMVQYNASGLSIHNAQGRQIADWGTLLNLPKIDGERSTVTATFTGTPGIIIPQGSRVRTQTGSVFASDAPVTLPADGTSDVLMRAVEIGPVVAPKGTLNRILDARAGWASVTNAEDARLGRRIESDAEYRRRYSGEVATHARDALESIRARVLTEDGVTAVLVRDNDTSSAVVAQGIEIPAGAILVIVQGGADADVARAIAQDKPAGSQTVGNTTVAWTHPQGFSVDINFRRVVPIPITVTAPLTALAGFPADGLATMRQNLLDWFTGSWPVPGPGIFDQTGIQIGESLDLARLLTPLNAVPGHVLGNVVVRRMKDDAPLGTPDLDERYTLSSDEINLSLSVAPLLLTAIVNGNQLTLTYNLPLNEGSVPAPGDFEVSVASAARGVTSVAIAGAAVTLTLRSAATAGQAVTLGYTPGLNRIKDPAGNEVATLAAITVTNATA